MRGCNMKQFLYIDNDIVDSIVVHDTIFGKPDFVLDTCLGDEWY